MTKALTILGCLGFVGCGGSGGDEITAIQLAQMAAEGYLQCERPAPPAEAIAACDDLAADAACTFAHDERETAGTCREARDGSGTLVCAPDRPAHHAPPTEAIAACNGLAADAECNFTHDEREIAGTCREARDGSGTLVCAPHRPAHSEPPAEAIAACDGLAVDASCSFALADHELSGTCRESRDGSGTLVCAPELPPGCHLGRPGHHGHGGHGPRGPGDR